VGNGPTRARNNDVSASFNTPPEEPARRPRGRQRSKGESPSTKWNASIKRLVRFTAYNTSAAGKVLSRGGPDLDALIVSEETGTGKPSYRAGLGGLGAAGLAVRSVGLPAGRGGLPAAWR
jgi:hypothetical protein